MNEQQKQQIIMTSIPCENCGSDRYTLVAKVEDKFPHNGKITVLREEIWQCLKCGQITITYDVEDQERI